MYSNPLFIAPRYTYSKTERLKSRKQIKRLFEQGKGIHITPLKALYLLPDDVENLLQAGVAVSSRHFKQAVHRNRVKRVLREVYRLHKPGIETKLQQSGQKMILFIIYTGKELPVYEEVKAKMQVIVRRLIHEIA